jgi:hypothetical protein
MNNRSIIIGMILGDGWVTFNKKNSIISFYHCPQQEEYLKYKQNLLEEIGYKTTNRFSKATEKSRARVMCWTRAYKELNLYRLLYSFRNTPIKRRKRVNISILKRLDAHGIAIWYMDDGHNIKGKNGINLATQSFTYEEHLIIQKYFLEFWDINFKIYKRKDKYFLVTYRDAKKFKDLVRPFVEKVPCMIYKIL